LYLGRIGIELFSGAMIWRPSDRLDLFAIRVNARRPRRPRCTSQGLRKAGTLALTLDGLGIEHSLREVSG
jgi:hypothetical protein